MADDTAEGRKIQGWMRATRPFLWGASIFLAPLLFVALSIDGLDRAIDREEILRVLHFAGAVAVTVSLLAAVLIGTVVYLVRTRSGGERDLLAASPKFRRIVFTGILCLLWGGAAFVVTEIWFRLSHQARLKEDTARKFVDMDRRKVCEAFHPLLWNGMWKAYRPGARVVHTNESAVYETSINSLGFRGDEEDIPSDDDFVIACLGGSTTVNGRSNNETYPALLEFHLRDAGWDVRVINCGVSSMKSQDYGSVITNLLKGITPDIVLEYNVVNDICISLIPKWQKELGTIPSLLLRSRFVNDAFGRSFTPNDEVIRDDLRSLTLANLRNLNENLAGIPLFVSSFVCPQVPKSDPSYRNLDFEIRHWWTTDYVTYEVYQDMVSIYNELIRTEASTYGLSYVPMAEIMGAKAEDFLDICHLTQAGIEKKAAAMAQALIPVLQKHPVGKRLERILE